MACEDVQHTTIDPETSEVSEDIEPTPAVPDYLASPNAVFADEGVKWRYGRPPDYTKTRKVWAEGKRMDHAAGSLPQLVENLVKNWEVEASFKPRLSDWRTIDHENYSFAMGGGPPESAEHMIKVGTYNGIIPPNEYYSPENSDFNSSHKTFKRMMPTFAWELLEVYSGPPRVAFRWRHWGVMKNDYVGFNNKGEKVTAKSHGGLIDIEGVTVAEVDDKIRLRAIQTWMDPLEMFRQIAPYGVVRKENMNRKIDPEAALDDGTNGQTVAPEHNNGAEAQADLSVRTADAAESQTEPSSASVLDQSTSSPDAGIQPSQETETNAPPPAARDNTAVLEHLENAHGLNETSLSKSCAPIKSAATRATEVEIQKPESMAPEVTQALPPAPIPASLAEHSPAEQAEESIADVPRSICSSPVTGDVEDVLQIALGGENRNESKAADALDSIDRHLSQPAELIHPPGHEVLPVGHALATSPESQETRIAHEEMSNMSPAECPFLQNRE